MSLVGNYFQKSAVHRTGIRGQCDLYRITIFLIDDDHAGFIIFFIEFLFDTNGK